MVGNLGIALTSPSRFAISPSLPVPSSSLPHPFFLFEHRISHSFPLPRAVATAAQATCGGHHWSTTPLGSGGIPQQWSLPIPLNNPNIETPTLLYSFSSNSFFEQLSISNSCLVVASFVGHLSRCWPYRESPKIPDLPEQFFKRHPR